MHLDGRLADGAAVAKFELESGRVGDPLEQRQCKRHNLGADAFAGDR